MNTKITVDQLTATVNRALKQYGDECRDIVDETAKKAADNAKKRLRNTSPKRARGGGKYAKSWNVQEDRSRLGSTYTVYSKQPGLPHLLENGHAKRNGTGWVNGRPHIAPAESAAVEAFETELTIKLGGAGV